MSTKYYELKLVEIADSKPGALRIATAALLECSLCPTVIDGMGGPKHGAICVDCGKALMNGSMRLRLNDGRR